VLRRLFKDFQGDILAIPGRLIALVFFVVLFFVPLVIGEAPYVLRTLIFANMFVIFAVSWDLLSGYTGQMNFGHALFFGVAAYTTALLNLRLDWQPWATIPLGAIGGVIAGLVVCIPALRLRGPYLSLVTLAFPLILLGVIFAFTDFTGGELGVSGLSRISESRITDYYISVVVMLASVMIMWKFTDARSSFLRIGIILHAIREDEIAARASGINTIRYKLLAFAVAGFFAGIAGAFHAHFMRIAGPSNLDILLSFQAIIWTVFGGIASIYGPVVGVYVLYPLMEFLRVVPEIRNLVFAGIVVERECPRCKLSNIAFRKTCRACNTNLYERATD